MRRLSPRTRSTLSELSGNHLSGYVTPMMLGARDASHHSATLALLVRHGFAERRKRNTLANMIGSRRGSWEYRITDAGWKALRGQP
jgi:hypothetical protein